MVSKICNEDFDGGIDPLVSKRTTRMEVEMNWFLRTNRMEVEINWLIEVGQGGMSQVPGT